MRLSLIPNKVMPIMWRMTLCSHRTSTIVLVCLLPVLLGSCLGGGSLNGVQQLDNVIEKLRAKIASSQVSGMNDTIIIIAFVAKLLKICEPHRYRLARMIPTYSSRSSLASTPATFGSTSVVAVQRV